MLRSELSGGRHRSAFLPLPGAELAVPSANLVALFTLDTLYTAVQSTGEIKTSEMVYDTT